MHGEVTDPAVDVFDREKVFIERAPAAAAQATSPACASCSSTSPPRDAVQFVAQAGATTWPRRSPRTTCCSTATRCSRAAFARTTTACRCSSASAIVRRCWRRRPAGIRASSSAPTARRTRARPSRPPAVAPASSPRTRRSSCTPRHSSRPARSTDWKASPASTARTSTGLPRNSERLILQRRAVDGAGDLAAGQQRLRATARRYIGGMVGDRHAGGRLIAAR